MLSKEKVVHRLSRVLGGGRSRAAAAVVAVAALAVSYTHLTLPTNSRV